MPLILDFGAERCCKVGGRAFLCRNPRQPPCKPQEWSERRGQSPLSHRLSPRPAFRILRRGYLELGLAEIPIINGSKPVNKHFSGSFRQHDTGVEPRCSATRFRGLAPHHARHRNRTRSRPGGAIRGQGPVRLPVKSADARRCPVIWGRQSACPICDAGENGTPRCSHPLASSDVWPWRQDRMPRTGKICARCKASPI